MKQIPLFNEFLNEGYMDKTNNLYIANKDTQVKNERGRNINIGNGTVISSNGGGWWSSVDGKIEVVTNAIEGNPDFDVINDTTWLETMDLIEDVEAWARNIKNVIQLDPKNAKKIIAEHSKVIEGIKKMLK